MLPAIIFLISGNYYFYYILPAILFLKNRIFLILIFLIGLIQAYYFNYPLEKFKFLNNKKITVIGKITNISDNKFTISAKSIYYKNLKYKFNEKIVIYFNKNKNFIIKENYKVLAKIKLKIPENYPIPGSFNYVNYLKGNGIKFIGYLISLKILKIENENFIKKYRNFLVKKIDFQNINENIKNFEKCIITGDKYYLSKFNKDFLIKNGISHLFVISGLHISIVFLFFLYLTRFILVKFNNYYIPFIVSLLFTFCYVIFTGANYPAVRAFFIVAILVLLLFIKRYRDPLNILFLIFFGIILIKPYSYLSISIQYSFLVVLFLILFFKNFTINKFLSIPAGTFICFLTGIPLTTYYFNAIYPKALLVNIIAVPFFSIFIIPFTAIFTFIPLKFLIKIISFNFKIILFIISHIPEIKPLYLFKLSGVELFFWYLAFAMIINTIKYFNIKKATITLFLIAFCFFLYQKIHNFNEKIAIINLRKTHAIVINHNNKNILINGGKKQIILNFLLFKNITSLDWLILTNYNKIFLESTQFLISNFKIKNFYYPKKFDLSPPEFVKSILKENRKYLKNRYFEKKLTN